MITTAEPLIDYLFMLVTLDEVREFLNPVLVLSVINVTMFIMWGWTIRRYGQLIHHYEDAKWWWQFWVEQAVKNGYEPDEAERNAAAELGPDDSAIDDQLEAAQNNVNARTNDT